ncbi:MULTISPECIES: zf-HC2 domain-containing protein [Chromobacterium]|uniref:zf-HC2 domain-containing protein n=1 Tax=Chromobacterium TaxID=535 RepID=UPI000D326226|nr:MULTISPECIES: zf-HC2 domain-containing protein [Chromobacterium]MCP1292265.1 zf-HC2 domain-containing protein [Chromobacterium sp. S0633]PTU64555.1 hypothetical protein DB032_06325 [Chromobacterium sp. Panama]UJB30143.1 zf-HC2 domain-containing protein [Chromobacterium sp. Beijing]
MKLSCRQASRLISASQDRPLSQWEHVRLRVHLFMCGNCRNFSQQLKQLGEAARKAGRGE